MRTYSPQKATQRARVAALVRHRGADDPAVLEAKRELAAENIASYVERVVAGAPPLTPEQRDRIAALLGGRAA